MFTSSVEKIYEEYGENTDDLIYCFLSFIEIESSFDENSSEYDCCLNYLEETMLKKHTEDFFDLCNSFIDRYIGDEHLISKLKNGGYEYLDVESVLKDIKIENASEQIDEEEQKKEDIKSDSEEDKTVFVYKYPPFSLLNNIEKHENVSAKELTELADTLQKLFDSLNIQACIAEIQRGPLAIQFSIMLADNVPVSVIKSIRQDIMMKLRVTDVEYIIPIPGTSYIGIKIPVSKPDFLGLKHGLRLAENKFQIPIGVDDLGEIIEVDFEYIDNLLIAGTTGSGKSKLLDDIIVSILMKSHPDEIKLLLIDTHKIQLSAYNGIPHLLLPAVVDVNRSVGAIKWLIQEAKDRIEIFSSYGARDIKAYNHLAENNDNLQPMSCIFCIIDDYADFILNNVDISDVFSELCRISRIAGIHLICAIQRPTANILSSDIKANFKTSISFKVASSLESQIVLGEIGAEKIHEQGIFQLRTEGQKGLKKGRAYFVSDKEIEKIVDYIKLDAYDIKDTVIYEDEKNKGIDYSRDQLFAEAARLVIESQKGSVGYLQRNFRIGFNRAARLMDQLADAGVVGPELGTKPRRILMTIEEFEKLI